MTVIEPILFATVGTIAIALLLGLATLLWLTCWNIFSLIKHTEKIIKQHNKRKGT